MVSEGMTFSRANNSGVPPTLHYETPTISLVSGNYLAVCVALSSTPPISELRRASMLTTALDMLTTALEGSINGDLRVPLCTRLESRPRYSRKPSISRFPQDLACLADGCLSYLKQRLVERRATHNLRASQNPECFRFCPSRQIGPW